MRASRADESYDKRLLRFTSPDLLIDDLGLRPLEGDELIDSRDHPTRYEQGSMIVTSNRALEEGTRSSWTG
ncbi:MAG: ATP-binding protein [Dehalococcoidia bacterium]